MMLLREEFWGLFFEERRVYGMDIPRRLHVRANIKQQKFITIQEINIYETNGIRSLDCPN
jgi:hypothetical protein